MCIHKSFWWPAPDASNGILSALLPRHHRRPHRAGAGAASGSGGPRGTGGCQVGPEALGKHGNTRITFWVCWLCRVAIRLYKLTWRNMHIRQGLCFTHVDILPFGSRFAQLRTFQNKLCWWCVLSRLDWYSATWDAAVVRRVLRCYRRTTTILRNNANVSWTETQRGQVIKLQVTLQ